MAARFKVLGQTQVLVGGRFAAEWAKPKVRGFVAALLMHPGKTMSTGDLVDWVWRAGQGPKDEAGTLQTYASRARSALEEAPARPRHVFPAEVVGRYPGAAVLADLAVAGVVVSVPHP